LEKANVFLNTNKNIWLAGTREKKPEDVGFIDNALLYDTWKKNHFSLPQVCAFFPDLKILF
jgi:hypothetical protein